MGWVPMQAESWEEIAAALPRPWPRPAAAFDLRWHEDQSQVSRGRVYFEQRWGWSKSRVAPLRSSDSWRDPMKSGGDEAQVGQDAGADRAPVNGQTPAVAAVTGGSPAPIGLSPGANLTPLYSPSHSPSPSQIRQDTLPIGRLGKEPTTTPDPTPTWARKHKGIPSVEVMTQVIRGLTAIKQPSKALDPDYCKTDASIYLKLWKASGLRLDDFTEGMEKIATWARESDEAENDIRGVRPDGRRWGPDRSHMVSTLCVQERFGDRLDAAQRWAAGDRQARRGEHREEPRTWAPEVVAEAHAFFHDLEFGDRTEAVAK